MAIVDEAEPVTLIGGAKLSKQTLECAIGIAPYLVAADGGADQALAMGYAPQAAIGDFDSISEVAKTNLPAQSLHPISEQDTTDFDKCLRNIKAPLIVGVGFSGDRIDHQLACYNTLTQHPDRRCILLDSVDLIFLAPPHLHLPLDAGTRVSLFPVGGVSGSSQGLKWAIDGLDFSPDGRVGTSNIATGPLTLTISSAKMLVILPAQCFEMVVTAFCENNEHWPKL